MIFEMVFLGESQWQEMFWECQDEFALKLTNGQIQSTFR